MYVENPLHYLRRRKVFYNKFQRGKKKKKTQTKEVKLIDFFGWILLLKKKVEYYLLWN